MKIVIRREWWRFWRHPLFGLNPFGWVKIKDYEPREGAIYVEDTTGKGLSGTWVFVESDFSQGFDDGIYIAPKDEPNSGEFINGD